MGGIGLKSRESYWHLAGSVCIDAMRTATDRVLLLELLPGSVFLCSSDEAPSWEVTRAAHLLDCLSVGLVSRDFIGKSWSLSRGKFFGRSLMSSPWREVDIFSSF